MFRLLWGGIDFCFLLGTWPEVVCLGCCTLRPWAAFPSTCLFYISRSYCLRPYPHLLLTPLTSKPLLDERRIGCISKDGRCWQSPTCLHTTCVSSVMKCFLVFAYLKHGLCFCYWIVSLQLQTRYWLQGLLFCFSFWDMVSLGGLPWPGTCYPCRPGWPPLHRDISASAAQVLVLKVCTAMQVYTAMQVCTAMPGN